MNERMEHPSMVKESSSEDQKEERKMDCGERTTEVGRGPDFEMSVINTKIPEILTADSMMIPCLSLIERQISLWKGDEQEI
jgi:hypothetical protein